MRSSFPSRLFSVLWLAAVLAAPAAAKQVNLYRDDDVRLDASSRRGLRFRVEDPQVELRLGGRLHVDALIADDDATSINDDIDVRRGRLYLAGSFLDDFSFKVEREFAGDQSGWRNVWFGYAPAEGVKFKAGNFVAPFGLEDVSSSNYSTFLERSISGAIAPSFQTGVGVQTNGSFDAGWGRSRWTWAAAPYVEPFDDKELDRHKSNHWGVATRMTFAPLAEKRRLVHLGGSFEYRDVSGGSRFRYRTRTETGIGPAMLNTGRLADVDRVLSEGAEAAVMFGPFSVQGEYMHATLERKNRPDPDFDGWYVQTSYVLTGESRSYSRSSGVFTGVDPKRKWGAVEVAFRCSWLDLNDQTVTGGKARDYTAGLNWYILENLRLMFNYVHVDGENNDLQSDDPNIYEMRLALFF